MKLFVVLALSCAGCGGITSSSTMAPPGDAQVSPDALGTPGPLDSSHGARLDAPKGPDALEDAIEPPGDAEADVLGLDVAVDDAPGQDSGDPGDAGPPDAPRGDARSPKDASARDSGADAAPKDSGPSCPAPEPACAVETPEPPGCVPPYCVDTVYLVYDVGFPCAIGSPCPSSGYGKCLGVEGGTISCDGVCIDYWENPGCADGGI